MGRKCAKCNEPLNEGDESMCLLCKKETSASGRQDIDDWKKREERDEW